MMQKQKSLKTTWLCLGLLLVCCFAASVAFAAKTTNNGPIKPLVNSSWGSSVATVLALNGEPLPNSNYTGKTLAYMYYPQALGGYWADMRYDFVNDGLTSVSGYFTVEDVDADALDTLIARLAEAVTAQMQAPKYANYDRCRNSLDKERPGPVRFYQDYWLDGETAAYIAYFWQENGRKLQVKVKFYGVNAAVLNIDTNRIALIAERVNHTEKGPEFIAAAPEDVTRFAWGTAIEDVERVTGTITRQDYEGMLMHTRKITFRGLPDAMEEYAFLHEKLSGYTITISVGGLSFNQAQDAVYQIINPLADGFVDDPQTYEVNEIRERGDYEPGFVWKYGRVMLDEHTFAMSMMFWNEEDLRLTATLIFNDADSPDVQEIIAGFKARMAEK